MKNNVIFKSIIRQPMRTIVLASLLFVATFFFVSRGVEVQIVTSETERIGEHYRSIGFFSSTHGTDLTEVVEIISESPYFNFGMHSRHALATLHDMHNINFFGRGHARGHRRLYGIEPNMEREAFFYGELLSKRGPSFTLIPYYTLQVWVDDVVAGYPEHVLEGHEMIIRWELEEGVEAIYEQLEVGERYFFNTSRDTGVISPEATRLEGGWHYLEPINEEEGVWFIQVEAGEQLDFTLPLLSHIPTQLELLEIDQRTKWVSTSVDMEVMPRTQEIVDEWFLREGRWLNVEDYEKENQVAVVNWLFAQIRGLEIGDTITLTFRELNIDDYFFGRVYCCCTYLPQEEGWKEHKTYEATFKIVGLFAHCRRTPTFGFLSKDMFVPESTVPAIFGERDYISHLRYSFVLTSTRHQEAFLQENQETISELGFEIRFVEHGAERFWESANPILQSLAFNFILFAGVFMATVALIVLIYFRQRQRDFAILRALGCPSKKVVRQLCMPLFLIWFPFILLGSVSGWVSAHHAATITLESIEPVEKIETEEGVDVSPVDEALDQLEEEALESTEGIQEADGERVMVALSPWWLGGYFAVAFGVILMAVLIGAVGTSRRPVLELLQGNVTRAEKRKRKQKKALQLPEEPIVLQPEKIKDLSGLLTNLETNKSNKSKGIRRNAYRRMSRSLAKTMLAMGVAFLMVFAIGWLARAIEYGDAEIERLYETTIVPGEIRPLVPGDVSPFHTMNQVIDHRTVTALLESGFVGKVYLEAGFSHSFLIVPATDGSFPEEIWEEQEFGLHNVHPLIAIDDLNTFLEVHKEPVDIFGEQLGAYWIPVYPFGFMDGIIMQGETVEITFMEGFDKGLFSLEVVYDFDSIVPIILRYNVAEEHGLEIGELAFLSHDFANVEPWRMRVQVVGIYTGRMHRHMAHEASLFPLSALEPIREILAASEYAGLITGYITVRFEVDPLWNREMDRVREALEEIATRPRAGAVHLTLDLFDGELEFVVQQMEQNLHLLQLLYPAAIGVSLLIGMSLSFLLMFRNTKNAAVMRVLGLPKGKVRQLLVAEQGIIALVGVILGVVVLGLLGSNHHLILSMMSYGGAYLAATLLGSWMGAILVSNRSALDLLQVKE